MKSENKWTKRRIFFTIWSGCGCLFMLWQFTTLQSRGLPPDTFNDDDVVLVEDKEHEIIFTPQATPYTSEVIFFQGGMVDPKAYAPLCRSIARKGFTCHLIKMNWRMPKSDYRKITNLFDLQSGNYIVGGHSQGGKMAAQFVHENPGVMKGLFLLGTSHPRDINMANRVIPTIKVYAEYDGLASVGEVLENKLLLPKNSTMLMIEGGNHSQFGYLGHLFMDDGPEISRKQQQNETLDYLIKHFLVVEKGL